MNKHPGMGVAINMLGGNEETIKTIQNSLNKTISKIRLKKDAEPDGQLILEFTDGCKIAIFDDGRSCCESRYITTDDNLSSFEDSVFINIETRDVPDKETEWGDTHEIQFLLITTSRGVFTLETHNEHNGYYSGFWLVVKEIQGDNDG